MGDLKRTLFGYRAGSVRSALSERDAALDRAEKTTRAAEEKVESLTSELTETQGRLAGLEEERDAAQELSASLTADLERSVAQGESTEAELIPLRRRLEEVRGELREAKEGSARLEEDLRQQAERLEQATAEAAECQASLRVLDESGGFQAAMSAQHNRVVELEALVEGYRELIDGGSVPPGASAEPGAAKETSAGPSTAGELAAVIEVAEQAVASIMESTRVRADEELRALDGERERIRRDVEAMTVWRDRAGPMIVSLQLAMHEMQGEAAEIGLRVNDALNPISNALTALTTQLASLGDLAGTPLDVSSEAQAARESDRVMELPREPLASRDPSDR